MVGELFLDMFSQPVMIHADPRQNQCHSATLCAPTRVPDTLLRSFSSVAISLVRFRSDWSCGDPLILDLDPDHQSLVSWVSVDQLASTWKWWRSIRWYRLDPDVSSSWTMIRIIGIRWSIGINLDTRLMKLDGVAGGKAYNWWSVHVRPTEYWHSLGCTNLLGWTIESKCVAKIPSCVLQANKHVGKCINASVTKYYYMPKTSVYAPSNLHEYYMRPQYSCYVCY